MAASACIVPGPSPTSPSRAADGLPGLPPGRARARLRNAAVALALALWSLLGFASGFALSIVAVPVAELAPVAVRPSSPSFGRVAQQRRTEPRFWRPVGSAAERPQVRLQPRVFKPRRTARLEVAAWAVSRP